MNQRARCLRIHLVEPPQDIRDTRLFFGCGFGTLRVSSYVGMRNRLLVLGAALAAFGLSLGSGFHFDDYAIFSAPLFHSSSAWRTLWAHPRPLTDLTFYLNFLLGGRDPLGYHAVNLALHLVAVWLAAVCMVRILPERGAWIAAALFAVHPLQAEAVDYVSGRSMLLGAALCLAALLAWLDERPWLSVAAFVAALLAEPQCAAFPALLLLLPRKEARRPAVPLACMAALGVAGLVRLALAPSAAEPAARYALAQGLVMLRYLRLLIAPYGFSVDPDVAVPASSLGILAWVAVLGLAWFAWRRRWWWLLAGLILMLPSSSFFPAPEPSADRRLYLSLFALAAAAALACERIPAPAVAPVALTAAALLTVVSISRTIIWNDDRLLWREAVERAPEKVRPKIELARVLPASQALELLSSARRLAPQDPRIAAETGRILLAQGQPDAALDEFTHALAADPRDALSLNNRGVALELLGQTEAARADFERALQIDPSFDQARENLAKLTGAK